MYVVPLRDGPGSSPISSGVEVTDSPYVVASMRIMSRMGKVAMARLGASSDLFGLHTLGDTGPYATVHHALPAGEIDLERGVGLRAETRCWGKMFALRIASVMAREQGWMAEHMLILVWNRREAK